MPTLLRGFPADAPGIVIVQHMPADFIEAFASRLDERPDDRSSRWPRRSTTSRSVPGRVLVIPGDIHGLIRRTGTGYRVELVEGPPVCRHRPSVDVLFRSAAQAAGPHAAGVILTGMGDDGAGGLLEMREAGSMTDRAERGDVRRLRHAPEAIRRGAAKFVTPARPDRRRPSWPGSPASTRAAGSEQARTRRRWPCRGAEEAGRVGVKSAK